MSKPLGLKSKVRVVYEYKYFSDHDNKEIDLKLGDEFFLIKKSSENWWYVKENFNQGTKGIYVPALYVQEVPEGSLPPIPHITPPPPSSSSSSSSSSSCQLIKPGPVSPGPPLPKPVPNARPSLKSQKKKSISSPQPPPSDSTPFLPPSSSGSSSSLLVSISDSSPSLSPPPSVFHQPPSLKEENLNNFQPTNGEFQGNKPSPEEEKITPKNCLGNQPQVSTSSSLFPFPSSLQSPPPLSSALLPNESISPSHSHPLPPPPPLLPSPPPSLPSPSTPPLEGSNNNSNNQISAIFLNGNENKIIKTESSNHGNQINDKVENKSALNDQIDNHSTGSCGSKIISNFGGSSQPPISDIILHGGSEYINAREFKPTESIKLEKVKEESLKLKFVDKKGIIQRTKYDDNSKKIKKNWSNVFAVLSKWNIFFYKEGKISIFNKTKGSVNLGKNEGEICLINAKILSIPEDKNHKKDSFMILPPPPTSSSSTSSSSTSSSSSIIFCFFHEDPEELLHWKDSIQNNILVSSNNYSPQSLPSQIIFEKNDFQGISDFLKRFLLRRPSKETIKKIGIYKDVVFGSTIASICEREKSLIPRFVEECIEAVQERGLKVDGLYRVSGNMGMIQKLRNMVDNNEFYNLKSEVWEIHVITGALKLFFRELSEPLFPFNLYDQFIQAKKNQLKEIVKKLPPANYKTVKLFFKHLNLVLENSKENRMQLHGLSIVFAPSLIWSLEKISNFQANLEVTQRGQLIQNIISNYENIFDN